MDFLNVCGFSVLPGKDLAFQERVRAYSAALAEAQPDAIEFVGIHATMFTSEKHSGDDKISFRLEGYDAMDRFTTAMGEDPELARLMDELGRLFDVLLGVDHSDELLKSVADITIWADYPEE